MNKARSSLIPENVDKIIFLPHNRNSVEGETKP